MTIVEIVAQAGSSPTLVAALMSALGVLGSCVAYLYKLHQDAFKEVKEKLTDCEDDRKDLWRALYRIDPSSRYLHSSVDTGQYDNQNGMP